MQLQKQHMFIIAGVGFALLAVFLAMIYLNQRSKAIEEANAKKYKHLQENQVPVLVAQRDIPKGMAIDSNSVEAVVVPKEFVPPGAVTSVDRIAGMIAISPIAKGEQVTRSKLDYIKQASASRLSEVTPTGKRAVTISVDNVAALAGMVKAGDYVDVLAMLPFPGQVPGGKTASQVSAVPVFQNVLILAVGQETGGVDSQSKKEVKKEATAPLITLALTPKEANLIAFIQEQGKIHLIMRSKSDSKIEPITSASWDTLFQYLFPQPPPIQYKDSDYVEIYRGLNKEKVLLDQ